MRQIRIGTQVYKIGEDEPVAAEGQKPPSKKGRPRGRRRARDTENGTFLGDDPSTPDKNEAWEDGNG